MVNGKAVRKTNTRISQNDRGDLVIKNVRAEDEGVVSCVLFRGNREAIANAALKIGEPGLGVVKEKQGLKFEHTGHRQTRRKKSSRT